MQNPKESKVTTYPDRLPGGPRRFRPAFMVPALAMLSGLAGTIPAQAHVKWFAPYVVGAAPAPVTDTLVNGWFWTGIVLVLAFFALAVAVERSAAGAPISGVLDRISAPLWTRSDDLMRAVIGGFFVAIFAVGGVYLTPDLQTPNEWVSWLQLLIAVLVFSRRTMP